MAPSISILEEAKPRGWGEGVEPKGAAKRGQGNIRILRVMVIRRPGAGNSNPYGMNGARSFKLSALVWLPP